MLPSRSASARRLTRIVPPSSRTITGRSPGQGDDPAAPRRLFPELVGARDRDLDQAFAVGLVAAGHDTADPQRVAVAVRTPHFHAEGPQNAVVAGPVRQQVSTPGAALISVVVWRGDPRGVVPEVPGARERVQPPWVQDVMRIGISVHLLAALPARLHTLVER